MSHEDAFLMTALLTVAFTLPLFKIITEPNISHIHFYKKDIEERPTHETTTDLTIEKIQEDYWLEVRTISS